MSAEDFISKLFKENEHKLDEVPGDELWNKIQSRLQSGSETTVEQNKATRAGNFKVLRSYKFYAAAAVLIILIVAAFFSFPKSKEITENLPATTEMVTETDQPTPLNDSEKDSFFKQSDIKQEQRILNDATILYNRADLENSKKPLKIDNVKIAEKKSEVVVPENKNKVLEINSEIVLPNLSSTSNSSNNKANQYNDYGNSNRNYAIPPSADITRAKEIESIANEAQNNSRAKKENNTNTVLNNKRNPQKLRKIELNSRLKIFEWMLGQWIDEEEEGGVSYENWELMSNNTITSTGFKMKGKNKIFEEKIFIQHDPSTNQVFLKMPLNESSQNYSYVMTSFDNERIIFDQVVYAELPDRVIIQRNLKGYSFIIVYNSGFIKPAQQTYLEHRNRVSNVRAIRIFKPYTK
jgi:hypothetical protein